MSSRPNETALAGCAGRRRACEARRAARRGDRRRGQGEARSARVQLVRRVERVDVVDSVPVRAEAYAARVGPALGVEVVVHRDVPAAVRDADVIITATWSKQPFLTRAMVRDGVHITAVGADEPAKGEVDAGLIASSLFVCDDRDLATSMGAIAGAGLAADAIHAELGEVIAGVKRGRVRADEITIFRAWGSRSRTSRAGSVVDDRRSREGAWAGYDSRALTSDFACRNGEREDQGARQSEHASHDERQLGPDVP